MSGKEKCLKCGEVVIKEKIFCVICKVICHYKCVGVNKDIMNKLVEIPNFIWSCDDCMVLISRLKNNIDVVKKKQNEVCENLTKINKTNKKIAKDFANFSTKTDKKLMELGNGLSEVSKFLKNSFSKTWADVVSNVLKQHVQDVNKEVHMVYKAIEKTNDNIKNINDIEERSNNIIIYRLNECQNSENSICVNQDKEKVLDICSHLSDGLIKDSNIKSIFRLGKKNEKDRPIMIKFFDKIDKNLIMENLNKLKNFGDFGNIGVSHDLNKEQRMDRKKLVDEAKRLEIENKGKFIFRVRGMLGNLRIIKLKKN